MPPYFMTRTVACLSIISCLQPIPCCGRLQADVSAISRPPFGSTSSLVKASKEMSYTSNSLCRQNYCTNPIFPGLNDLPRLEALQWQCSSSTAVSQYMNFCKQAVLYDPALPSPVSKATAVPDIVKAQEDAAMTMFVYHLNGMGFEAWDHQNPAESDNECVRSVWKMVCFTYFPRADAGCKAGQRSIYKRPCKSCCHNYIRHCGVECCDESVQCVFSQTTTNSTGQLKLVQTGYVDSEGPSATCTGGAHRASNAPWLLLLAIVGTHFLSWSPGSSAEAACRSESRQHKRISRLWLCALLGVLGFSLQGCEASIPTHRVGNWRAKQNYLTEFAYVTPGKPPSLNSCNTAGIPANQQCGGRGFCKYFALKTASQRRSEETGSPPLSFCHCEREWADPECGTKRKSQMKAFLLSTFLGFTGADYFYLGFPLWGTAKLSTLGGCGFWWLLDIVRTGAGPVYAHNFRTAQDLPHWVAVLSMVSLCMLSGFIFAIQNFLSNRRRKRGQALELLRKEESKSWNRGSAEELAGFDGPRYRTNLKGQPHHSIDFQGRPQFTGYGAALPMPLHNAGAPIATNGPQYFGPAGVPGMGSPTPAGKDNAPLHMPYVGAAHMGTSMRYDPEANATGRTD